jgi:hypothetical protein
MRDEKMAKLKGERLIVPVSVPCYDYKSEDGEPMRKTVIIAPIKIIEFQDGSIQISWACNRGAFCKDQKCRYSHAAQAQEG